MGEFGQIIASEPLVLVDFYATWCHPCKMMHPVLEQLKRQMGDKIRILKVDIDNSRELAAQYRIQSVPTFILFRNGEQAWRQSGAMPLHELARMIEGQER